MPEQPARIDDHGGEHCSPADRGKLPQPASSDSPSRHREASDARANQCFGCTATALARRVGRGESSGFAQSSTRPHSPDQGRSEVCLRHQHGRCGRFCAFWRAEPGRRRTRIALRARAGRHGGHTLWRSRIWLWDVSVRFISPALSRAWLRYLPALGSTFGAEPWCLPVFRHPEFLLRNSSSASSKNQPGSKITQPIGNLTDSEAPVRPQGSALSVAARVRTPLPTEFSSLP
eukprot:COSAG02_NODE_670_length_18676_cov_29.852029_7_plen_232_part_00